LSRNAAFSGERYLIAVTSLHETLGSDGETDAAKVVREVIETVVLHPAGASRNRHTSPPKIEIIGRLEDLLGSAFFFPKLSRLVVIGDTLASMPPENQRQGWLAHRSPPRGNRW
jgi:hypothetical protein